MTEFQQQHKSQSSIKKFGAVFFVCAVIMFALVWAIVFAKARVVILSRPEETTANLTINISRNPIEGEVRGDVFVLEETYSQTFPAAQGTVNMAGKAEGKITITSTMTRPQVLIATTRVLTTDNVLFRLKSAVTVPAEGSVEAEVIADQAGPQGAIANATFTIPGLNADSQKFFTVRSVGAFTLPSDEGTGGVTEDAVNAAADSLKQQSEQKLQERLESFAATAGTNLSAKSFSYVILKKESTPAIGQPGREFVLTLTVRGTAVYYDQESFNTIAEQGLREDLAFGKALGRLVPEATSTTVQKVDPSQGRGTIKAKVQGTMVISGELPALATKQFAGVTTDAAKRYAERIDGIASVSIKVWPPWQDRLPDDPERIVVEVR